MVQVRGGQAGVPQRHTGVLQVPLRPFAPVRSLRALPQQAGQILAFLSRQLRELCGHAGQLRVLALQICQVFSQLQGQFVLVDLLRQRRGLRPLLQQLAPFGTPLVQQLALAFQRLQLPPCLAELVGRPAVALHPPNERGARLLQVVAAGHLAPQQVADGGVRPPAPHERLDGDEVAVQ